MDNFSDPVTMVFWRLIGSLQCSWDLGTRGNSPGSVSQTLPTSSHLHTCRGGARALSLFSSPSSIKTPIMVGNEMQTDNNLSPEVNVYFPANVVQGSKSEVALMRNMKWLCSNYFPANVVQGSKSDVALMRNVKWLCSNCALTNWNYLPALSAKY